jgi:hypothetical protein
MLERTTTRALPVLNRTVDLAPAAQACCGLCRTCMTTNIFTLIAGGAVAIAAAVRARIVKPLS